MNSNLSIFNQLRPFTIGFDDVFDHFEKMADYSFQSTSYPPYNIVKTGDFTYDIEVALAGYGKDDVSVDYADSVLTIKSVHEDKDDKDTIHKGISRRKFTKSSTVADDVEVKGAELKDGLLRVSLEKIVPESKKPRTIKIK